MLILALRAQGTARYQCSSGKVLGGGEVGGGARSSQRIPHSPCLPRPGNWRGPSGLLMTREGLGTRRTRTKRGSGQRPGGGARGGAHRPASPRPRLSHPAAAQDVLSLGSPRPRSHFLPRSPPPHAPRPAPAPCLTPSRPRPERAASLGCLGRRETAPTRTASRVEGTVVFRGLKPAASNPP